MLVTLMSCDIIIYDIVSDPSQVDEASWAITGLNNFILKNFKLILNFLIILLLASINIFCHCSLLYTDTM